MELQICEQNNVFVQDLYGQPVVIFRCSLRDVVKLNLVVALHL